MASSAFDENLVITLSCPEAKSKVIISLINPLNVTQKMNGLLFAIK